MLRWFLLLATAAVVVSGFANLDPADMDLEESEEWFSSTDKLNYFFKHGYKAVFEKLYERMDVNREEHADLARKLQKIENKQKNFTDPGFHPVVAYSLLDDWSNLRETIYTMKKEIEIQDLDFPLYADSDGALEGILRIQLFYKYTTKYMATGMGDNITLLSMDQILDIGTGRPENLLYVYAYFRIAKKAGKADLPDWRKKWLLRAVASTDDKKEKAKIYLTIAREHYEIKQYYSAQKNIKKAAELDPHNVEIGYELENYMEEVPADAAREEKHQMMPVAKTYRVLCRGENLRDTRVTSGLYCRYLRPNVPYNQWRLEVVSRRAAVFVVYNITTAREAHVLQQRARARMMRSKAGEAVTRFRVSQTAWLNDEDPTVRRVSKKIAIISGMDTSIHEEGRSGAEYFQLVNYGLGGQYDVHPDPFSNPEAGGPNDPNIKFRHSGDRIATFMIYLSDVIAGGATVFPENTNAQVVPVKNSGVLWYNMDRAGILDINTMHAGCPVARGSKWTNKWIRINNQMFRKKCGKTKRDKWTDLNAFPDSVS